MIIGKLRFNDNEKKSSNTSLVQRVPVGEMEHGDCVMKMILESVSWCVGAD